MSGAASKYEPLNHDDIPNASFTTNTVSGVDPLPVLFTDTSTPNSGNHPVTEWFWEFGDGGTSELQNPIHVFTGAVGSTFTVVLTVANDIGHDRAQTQIVITSAMPSTGTHLYGTLSNELGHGISATGLEDLTDLRVDIVSTEHSYGYYIIGPSDYIKFDGGGETGVSFPYYLYNIAPGDYTITFSCHKRWNDESPNYGVPVADWTLASTVTVTTGVATEKNLTY